MEKYIKELGYDLKGFTVNSLQLMFAHVYYIWRVLRPELGYEKALKTYGAVWDAIALVSFRQAMKNLGIKEVKDIPTLGKIVDSCFSAVPCLYETVENTLEHHKGRVHWCANPAYGPHDCTYSRHEYYRNAEVPLTIDPYLSRLVAEAKRMGLKEDIEVAVPTGRCRDGNASFCQIHLWEKGTPELEPEVIPDSQKTFIEDEMGKEEPIIFILQKQGKKLEDFGLGTLISFIFTDVTAWDGLEGHVGKQEGLGLYTKIWRNYPPLWVKEAKLEFEIGKITELKELAKIIAFCEKKRFTPYQILTNWNDQVTLTGKSDPFAEIATRFLGKKLGDSYFEAVAVTDQDFINEVIKEAKMADKVKVTAKRRLLKGDDKNEIVIKKT